MERPVEGEDQRGSKTSVIEDIRALCALNARADLSTEEHILLFLQSWWSRTYNRPLKDPLLQEYTFEELLYEFYDRVERQAASEESAKQEDVKIEVEKEKAVLDWAEQEEKRELEALKASKGDQYKVSIDDVAWMEQQIQKDKEAHGDTFGEDLELSFDEE